MACNDLLIAHDDSDCDGASGGNDCDGDDDCDDDGDGDIVVTFWGWHLTPDSCRLPPKITLGDCR